MAMVQWTEYNSPIVNVSVHLGRYDLLANINMTFMTSKCLLKIMWRIEWIRAAELASSSSNGTKNDVQLPTIAIAFYAFAAAAALVVVIYFLFSVFG